MTFKTDDEIKREVEQELRWDTRVEETEIGVTVKQGTVTLTGTVGSYGKKVAALEAVFRVSGVLDVANDIQVKLPSDNIPTDTEIARAVRHAFEWDVLVPAEHIRSTVANGWVTLEGDVETLSQREDAERAVRYLTGVKGVHNQLRNKVPDIKTEDVQQIIEDALSRRAEREAERIRVSVHDGIVILDGNVRTWAEKRAILGAVSHAPGVHSVRDHLQIRMFA
jgi:osmotically-inducible protein OsmY